VSTSLWMLTPKSGDLISDSILSRERGSDLIFSGLLAAIELKFLEHLLLKHLFGLVVV
jgi:hypothetical protein